MIFNNKSQFRSLQRSYDNQHDEKFEREELERLRLEMEEAFVEAERRF